MTALRLLLGPMLLLCACRPPLRSIRPPPAASVDRAGPAANPEARRLYLLGRLQLGQGELLLAAEALAAARRFDPRSPWIAIAQGDVALAEGELAAARRWWHEATELDSTCGPAWLRLARAERAHGDLGFSARAYQQAVDAGEGWRARAELVEVLVLMDKGEDAQRAVAAWVDAEVAPSRSAWRARAEAHWSVGDHEGAWTDLHGYLEAQPEDMVALDMYLVLTRRVRRYGQALARLDDARRALPADQELARRRVALLDEIGHWPKLLEALDQLVALETEADPGLDVDRARVLLALGRPAQALALVDQVAELAPRWPHLVLIRAQALLALERPEQARRVLLEAPPAPGQVVARARLLREAGDPDAAWALLEPAVEQNPTHAPLVEAAARHAAAVSQDLLGQELAARLDQDGQRRWIRLLVQVDRQEDARALLEARIAAAPTGSDLRDLGALRMGEDPAAGAALLTRAVAADPDDLRSRYLLASALLEAGRLTEARTQARLVLEADPLHSDARNLLAWSLVEAGEDLLLAEAYARQAVDAAPADAHVVDTLGWVLARAGRLDEALPILQEAASLAPAADEIRAHVDAVRAGVLPAPPWQTAE